MSSIIFLALIALILLINILLGVRRGMLRSLVRAALLIACIPIAILLTRLVSGALGASILPVVSKMLESSGAELTSSLLAATEALEALVTMVAAALSFSSIYLTVGLISKLADKPLARLMEKRMKPSGSSRAIGAALGLLAGVILTIAILCPITGFLPVADGVVAMMDDETAAHPVAQEIHQATTAPAVRAVKLLGGDLLFSAATTTNYAGESVNLTDEATALTDLIAGYVSLSDKPSTEWNETEIKHLDSAATSFEDSRITADLVAILLCDIGTAWGNGDTYLGAEFPSQGPLLDPTMKTFFLAVSDSTGASVRQNIHTVSDVIATMIRHDAFTTLKGSGDSSEGEAVGNNLAILTLFSDAEFTEGVVDVLYQDEQLRVMVPEILNIGVRAVAISLGVPDSHAALYDTIMQQCSDAFNATAGKSDVERMVLLGDELYGILNAGGVGVSPSTASAMAMGMVADYASRGSVTADDMRAWFAGYAAASANLSEQVSFSSPVLPTPLGLAFGDATVMFLSSQNDAPLKGAAAVAAYIQALQKAPSPYQILTLTNTSTGKLYYVVSMSDGTLRYVDENGRLQDEDQLNVSGISALVGGEFSSIHCAAPWALAAAPTRITQDQLTFMHQALLPTVSPLPDDYVPSGNISDALTATHLQNAQNTSTPITDANSLVAALNGAANHELTQGNYSAGTASSMANAETFESALPSLGNMLLNDLDQICAGMTPESASSVGQAVSTLANYLSSVEVDPEGDVFTDLFTSAEGTEVIASMLDSLTEISGDNTAATNTLLAGASYLGADISALRAELERENVSVSQVATHMLGTADVLSTLVAADDPNEQIHAIEDLLSTLTEDSARAIAAAVSPSMLRGLGLPDTSANSTSSLIRSAFIRLADAKKNGMTEEQFRKEADALTSVFTLAIKLKNAQGSSALFGKDALLGRDASSFLDTVISSNIISCAMIDMVGGTSGAYFTVSNYNPFSVPALNEVDSAKLLAALDQAKTTLPQYPNSNGELWSPQNNQVTRQDVARRLVSFAALFGLDYSIDCTTIAQ